MDVVASHGNSELAHTFMHTWREGEGAIGASHIRSPLSIQAIHPRVEVKMELSCRLSSGLWGVRD